VKKSRSAFFSSLLLTALLLVGIGALADIPDLTPRGESNLPDNPDLTQGGSPTGDVSASASATTSDIFSVNFYAYGALNAADYDAVTLEVGETAGVGAFNTTGWENYNVPWGLTSPANPVTIASVQGSSATLTLNDVRNGGPYLGSSPHSTLPGDGNGDLMDGHCNATDDPYDGSCLFDMQVSNIPYAVYDLIVYIGANAAQFGDGTGKIVLNGGTEQNFTLPSGEFASFAEITDAATPGNYIVFTGLRSSSLTLLVWGNGFNHIGPTGFQIVQDISGVIPPGPATSPNPADGVVGLSSNTDLSWTSGVDAESSDIYFGTDSTPDSSEFQGNVPGSTFDPGALAHATYYWRIDEVNSDGTTTGPVWSFTVGSPAKAFRPMPYDGMTAVALDAVSLSWVEGESATAVSSDVYFGTDSIPDAGEFIGNQTATTYYPATLAPGTTYYWRVDQVNAEGTTTGDVWSFTTPIASVNRVKIFIMAGQSNTEGHGEMNPVGTQGTLEYMVANNPAAYGHLKDGGNWAVRDDAWIWYKRGGSTLVNGGLTAGYGASSTTIGPELQFGHAMGNYYGEKVLIIKTAWGGKSLRTDFRPPSSGWELDTPVTAGDEGFYYNEMLDFVVDVMENLPTYFPTYNSADGYEIAGFGWHQGWNDRVTSAYAVEYEANMKNFIKDIRASLGVPAMPFVIATTGMDGNSDYSVVELAQLAMEDFTAYPQFNGNVAVTDTQGCWFDVASSPGEQGYHWNRNAESYFLIGQSMADEMQALIAVGGGGDLTPPTPNPASFAVAPAADSDTAISMTATTGSDASGPVEYLFSCTSGTGHDSGWQSSPSYTDTGLSTDTTYSYTVTMRDNLGNVGTPSNPVAVTTDAVDWGSIPFEETFETLIPGDLNGQRGWVSDGGVVQSNTSFDGSLKAGAITTPLGSIQHSFNGAKERVWSDMHVQVVHMSAEPLPDADATVAFYVSTNSQVMVFNGTNAVSSGLTAAAGEWVRFTTFSDYNSATWLLYVNGIKAGPFQFFDPTASGYHSLSVTGEGSFVDDLVVTETLYASGGIITPLSWVFSYGGNPTLSNQDGDSLTLDQEYLIETDPTVSNEFKIITLGFSLSNNPYLQYNANGLPNGTLTVSNSTDLVTGSWEPLAGSLSTPGSNVVQWTGSNPAGTNGIMRIHVTK